MTRPAWPCLADARRSERGPRWPVLLDGRRVGSVNEAGRAALSAAWPRWVVQAPGGGLTLSVGRDERDAVFAEVNAGLRARGLIHAWRDEPFALWNEDGECAAVIERASSRFWGALTLGAHANGYVADPATGRPTHLWIARRAWNKPTDPGRLDNLIGAGVPHGQSPSQALRREAWEEAGLQPHELGALAPGRVIELACDIPEGWQHEWLYVFDLALPPQRVPVNQDGEVAEHRLHPLPEALRAAASGEMTTDAALATLDFALRHGLLGADAARELGPRLAALRVDPVRAARFETPADSAPAASTFSKSETPPQSR
jgi:8-oxo-dGTP pyrophosphatase MutT (NUDIX family)